LIDELVQVVVGEILRQEGALKAFIHALGLMRSIFVKQEGGGMTT
jgi:hypothetical protein